MKAILATILAAAIVTPAAAHNSKTPDTVPAKKIHHGAVQHAAVVNTKEVYLDGLYVGADPDWRIRDTLRNDARHDK